MKKIHFILLVLLGLFLMPSIAIACGNGSKKSCCKKEISSINKEKKSCCGSDRSKEKAHTGCEGKCGHSECGCSSTCPTSLISFLSENNLKSNIFSYSSIEKVKFVYATPSISAGFYSIWLIPKIS